MKEKKTISLRTRVIALLLLCWLLPLILLVGVNVQYMKSDRLQSQIANEAERLMFCSHNSMQMLEGAIKASRQASYDRVLVDNYLAYKEGELSEYSFMSNEFFYLRDKYARDDRLLMAALWFREDPDRLYCSAANTGAGTTYAAVKDYWTLDHDAIFELSRTLDTYTAFVLHEDRLYLVRNILTPDFKNVATLVFLINQDYCFRSYNAFSDGTSVTLRLDGYVIRLSGEKDVKWAWNQDEPTGSSVQYQWSNQTLNLYSRDKGDGHELTASIRYGEDSDFALFRGMDAFFVMMAVCLVPLILLLLSVFYKHVNRPLRSLLKGAEEIENGNLGYQLDYEPDSTEFKYLASSFNTMSKRLEYQFRHIYEEELALRDARIKALQSHINPHFMNNTLEIINWEARMSGNDKVCDMIEALSTLMNAGIDRKMRPVIPLSEEMIYVNAYLHITKERLGSRLTVINEFPEDIMGCSVPRLILQPVIENAIEHGVVQKGTGTVILYGYREGDFLYLEIMNESVLSPEDEAKIARLLDPEYDTSKEASGNLGIANVNQRLRIIYGEDCGLKISQMDEEHVKTQLTIRVSGNKNTIKSKKANEMAKGQDESTNNITGYSKSPKKD